MAKLDKHERELMRVMFGLGESLAEAPESEVLREAERNGVNLLDEAEEVRGILRSAARAHLQRKLRESRRAYETAVTEIESKQYDLPESAEERRRLLEAVLRGRPEFEPIVLTAQHRNFRELSDDDVLSFLKQLKILGLLDISPSPTTK